MNHGLPPEPKPVTYRLIRTPRTGDAALVAKLAGSDDHPHRSDQIAYWYAILRATRAAGCTITAATVEPHFTDADTDIETGAIALFAKDEPGTNWQPDSERIDEPIREEYRECVRVVLKGITEGTTE